MSAQPLTPAVHATPGPPAQPARGFLAKLRLAAIDVKLSHSVFALPFAVLGAFIAKDGVAAFPSPNLPTYWSVFAQKLGLVVVCMIAARTWAMLVNRLVDRHFDAANPRTARRIIASGRLRSRDGWFLAVLSAGVVALAAGAFWILFENRLPLLLSPVVLAWLAFYSYTKRFTMLCHGVLGSALAIAPVCAAIAIRPEALAEAPALWFLAGMVLFWVAGFDVIYALQDVDYDLRTGLYSLPSSLGPRGAIWISRLLHAVSFSLLLLAAGSEPRFGLLFYSGVGLVGVLLIFEHVVLARRGLRGLDMAFFTLNGVISCVLGLAGVLDLAVV